MAKTRVHELARELGVNARELLAFINSTGEFVKSINSTVETPVARQVRERFLTDEPLKVAVKPSPPDLPATNGRPSVVERPAPAIPPSGWLNAVSPESPATAAIRRNLGLKQPVQQPGRRRDARPGSTRVRDRWVEHWFAPDEKLAWQQAGVYEPEDALSALHHGFTPETFAQWGRHHLNVEAVRRAVELGLTPDQLDRTINGNSIGIMLQTGSRVDEIRALMAKYPVLMPEDRWG